MLKEQIERRNASTLFLIRPIVGDDSGNLEKSYQLINSYLRDKNRDDLTGDLLFVLFRPNNLMEFKIFVDKEEIMNENFVEDYDYDGGYIVLVYKVGIAMKRDFKRFKEGKYSEFSDFTKSLFKKTVKVGFSSISTIQWDVFTKSATLRKELEQYVGEEIDPKSELYPYPTEARETLDIDEIIKDEEERKSTTESSEVSE